MDTFRSSHSYGGMSSQTHGDGSYSNRGNLMAAVHSSDSAMNRDSECTNDEPGGRRRSDQSGAHAGKANDARGGAKKCYTEQSDADSESGYSARGYLEYQLKHKDQLGVNTSPQERQHFKSLPNQQHVGD